MKVEMIVLAAGLLLTMLNIVNWVLARYEKAKSVGANDAITKADIDILRQGNASISIKIDKMDSKMDDYQERLVRVEESSKQAHKRIDGLEGRVHG